MMNYMNKLKYILHFDKLTITTYILTNQIDYLSTRIPLYLYLYIYPLLNKEIRNYNQTIHYNNS